MEHALRGDTTHGLLWMLSQCGGRVQNRIRVQKFAYLLKLKAHPDFKNADFAYHHYGPYSRELSDTLQDVVSAGLVKEEQEKYSEEQVRFAYNLTDSGKEWLRRFGERPELTGLAEAVEKLAPSEWRALELAATAAFLETNERAASRDESFKLALRQKPACRAFEEAARAVLGTLQL